MVRVWKPKPTGKATLTTPWNLPPIASRDIRGAAALHVPSEILRLIAMPKPHQRPDDVPGRVIHTIFLGLLCTQPGEKRGNELCADVGVRCADGGCGGLG